VRRHGFFSGGGIIEDDIFNRWSEGQDNCEHKKKEIENEEELTETNNTYTDGKPIEKEDDDDDDKER